MQTRMVIGDVVPSAHWTCMGIQAITGSGNVAVLTPPTTGGVTTFNDKASPKFATIQAQTTTWFLSDVTTISPSTLNVRNVFANLVPEILAVDLSKVQLWCTTVAGVVIVSYYK